MLLHMMYESLLNRIDPDAFTNTTDTNTESGVELISSSLHKLRSIILVPPSLEKHVILRELLVYVLGTHAW